MSEPPLSNTIASPSAAAWAARRLLRAARAAALGTIGAGGLPAVTLVTPATAPDLSVLLLLSSLSEHRRNLERDGACGLMVSGPATDANPQTAPRLSLGGRGAPVPPEETRPLLRRWLAAHPYAEGYAAFTDFALWRFVPERAQFVGGFAAAHRLGLDALRPPPEAAIAIAAAETELLADCAADEAAAMAVGAGAAPGLAPGPWRLAAIDPDGCDLVQGEVSLRLPFAETALTVEAARSALDALRRTP